MKIIPMMGRSHPKGGGWAPGTAPGAVRLQVRTSGTGTSCSVPSPVVCVLCASSLLPSPQPSQRQS